MNEISSKLEWEIFTSFTIFDKISQIFQGYVGLAPPHIISKGIADSDLGLLNMYVAHENFKKCFAIKCTF